MIRNILVSKITIFGVKNEIFLCDSFRLKFAMITVIKNKSFILNVCTEHNQRLEITNGFNGVLS